MSAKSNKPEDMLLRVIRVAELLAKGADTTSDTRQQGQPASVIDHEPKTQTMQFPVT